MRRLLMRFLPVFLLALAVQILAPVAACLARSVAATDPLAGAVLCQGMVADQTGGDQQPNHHMRDGSCAACAVVTGIAPPEPQARPDNVHRQIYRVVWRAYAPDGLAAKIASSAQARGPPILS